VSATVWVAVIGTVTTVGGSVIAWLTGREGRAAVAQKDEADAAESLSQTVAALGMQVRELYEQLAKTERRALSAEVRAAAAEHEAAMLRFEVGRLRIQVAHGQSD
jgi:hypothetical protein